MEFRANGGLRDPSNLQSGAFSSAGPSRVATARPLSDIKEITESSLLDTIPRKPVAEPSRVRPPRATPLNRDCRQAQPTSRQPSRIGRVSPFASPESNADRSSIHSIPLENVPPRSSSRNCRKRSVSIPREPAVLFPPPRSQAYCIANTGRSQSPVKDVAPARPLRIPSKTIIKVENQSSNDILDQPTCQHPRLKVNLIVAAPLFVGGSSVEGSVTIIVDEADRVRHRKTLTLERVSVDLFGIEEVSGARRNIFLSLGNELVDLSHPPPGELVESQLPITPQERSWILIPSSSTLPFLLTLPLDVGPPPFTSKHARIRYVLCASLQIRDSGRQLSVRCTQETSVLSVYDPEKALMSLPSPLTASDEWVSSREKERIAVTAGLHRQVWVSGTNIFADVHVVNDSRKTIKKLELQLVRVILYYRHAAAATLEMSASQHRMFDQQERAVACRSVIKPGEQGWNGVQPHTTVLRTCELEVPRSHATIKCNKYFEVRYYLNIIVSTSHKNLVTVQLPIILIHMNSLDVPTNSVAQVAAAIEEKRERQGRRPTPPAKDTPGVRRRPSRPIQGRAFAAPRAQSLERARAHEENLQQLQRELDASPRKNSFRQGVAREPSSFSFRTPQSKRQGRIIQDADANELRRRLGHAPSFGSNVTNRSFLQVRNPPRASSALGFYLQENENRGASSSGTSSLKKPSFEVKRQLWPNERWKPAWLDGKPRDGIT